MCFSPSVSFGAGIVLAATGVAATATARTPAQKLLAAIPLLFAVQQGVEGVVWMSLLNPAWAHLKMPAIYVFLIFAQIVWPLFMPVCAWKFEHRPGRRKAIAATFLAGCALSVYIISSLLQHAPAATALAHHIHYELYFALAHKWYYGLVYFVPAVLSLLLSSQRSLRWLGGLLLASYVCARLLFHWYVISVWCFFAAALSLLILFMIMRANQDGGQATQGLNAVKAPEKV